MHMGGQVLVEPFRSIYDEALHFHERNLLTALPRNYVGALRQDVT